MSKQILEMWYHPAQKEVIFKRYQGKVVIPIREDSRLQKYMRDERGTFILQDHGSAFFDDIAHTFDGVRDVTIRVITTKADFVDFQQMVEYYNASSNAKCYFHMLPGSVQSDKETYLTDMAQICNDVRKHGQAAIKILESHKLQVLNMPRSNSEAARKSVEKLVDSIQNSIDSIRKNLDLLGKNNVNLCFAGTYSTGKSALINAILGYRILPESDKSQTARMFKIRSPRNDENIAIFFSIRSRQAELRWSDADGKFLFAINLIENRAVAKINSLIEEIGGLPRHNQIYRILEELNKDSDVTSDITVYFPIPLDTENVQFTIFDTPGTGSNSDAHEKILREALEEQKSSILIFVVAPKKFEGTGNSHLLSFIKDLDNKTYGTSIDINRSLFVINMFDDLRQPKQIMQLNDAEITDTNDPSFSIRLSEKKLIHTSALFACAANAVQNGVADEACDDEGIFEDALKETLKRGPYYRYNRCAASEFAKERLIQECDRALCEATAIDNKTEMVHIASGLYALEHEMLEYGQKYAVAVRAYAIINSVDKVLAEMQTAAGSLEMENLEEVKKLSDRINRHREELEARIVEKVGSFRIDAGREIPDELQTRLGIDVSSINNRISTVAEFVENKMKRLFNARAKYSEKDRDEIATKATSVFDEAQQIFSDSRKTIITTQRDLAIAEVQEDIRASDDLTVEGKNFICSITPPDIAFTPISFGKLQQAYQESIKETKWFHKKYVDRDELQRAVRFEMQTYGEGLASAMRENYAQCLNDILAAVQKEFADKIGQYSLQLRGMIEDKETMEHLRDKIRCISGEILTCQEELKVAIWKESENE